MTLHLTSALTRKKEPFAPASAGRMTDHIPAIIDMVEQPIARGHAYAAEGHVRFHAP